MKQMSPYGILYLYQASSPPHMWLRLAYGELTELKRVEQCTMTKIMGLIASLEPKMSVNQAMMPCYIINCSKGLSLLRIGSIAHSKLTSSESAIGVNMEMFPFCFGNTIETWKKIEICGKFGHVACITFTNEDELYN